LEGGGGEEGRGRGPALEIAFNFLKARRGEGREGIYSLVAKSTTPGKGGGDTGDRFVMCSLFNAWRGKREGKKKEGEKAGSQDLQVGRQAGKKGKRRAAQLSVESLSAKGGGEGKVRKAVRSESHKRGRRDWGRVQQEPKYTLRVRGSGKKKEE